MTSIARPAGLLLLVVGLSSTTESLASENMSAQVFSKKVEKELREQRGKQLTGWIDASAFVKRVLRGADLPDAKKQAFSQRVAKPGALTVIVNKLLAFPQHARLLKVDVDGTKAQAVFRYVADENFSPLSGRYLELELQQNDKGEWKIVDSYDFARGMLYSDVFRMTLTGRIDTGMPKVMTDQEKRDWQVFKNAAIRQDKDAVLKAYDKLSKRFQEIPDAQFHRFLAALHDNDARGQQALQEYAKLQPNNPSLANLTLVIGPGKKRWKTLRTAAQVLQTRVGDDPYLELIQAVCDYYEKDKDASARRLKKIVADDPTVLGAYWMQLALARDAKKFDEMVRLLDTLEKHGITLTNLEKPAANKDFIESKEYQEWKKKRSATD